MSVNQSIRLVPDQNSSWDGWQHVTPVLRFANFYDAEPGNGFGPRYIEDFQILLVQAGMGRAIVNDQSFEIVAGDLIFYGPNELHAVISSKEAPLKLIGLHFVMRQEDLQRLRCSPGYSQVSPFKYVDGAPANPLQPRPLTKISPRVASRIQTICESLVLSYLADRTGKSLEKRGLLLILFELWHDEMIYSSADHALPTRYRHAIDEAQSAILKSLSCPPTLTTLAAASRLSVRYFDRLFKQRTGYSVHDYVLHQRLLAARRLLVDGQYNVSEVAELVGFQDPHYFSRRFAKKFGVPPSLIRSTSQLG